MAGASGRSALSGIICDEQRVEDIMLPSAGVHKFPKFCLAILVTIHEQADRGLCIYTQLYMMSAVWLYRFPTGHRSYQFKLIKLVVLSICPQAISQPGPLLPGRQVILIIQVMPSPCVMSAHHSHRSSEFPMKQTAILMNLSCILSSYGLYW